MGLVKGIYDARHATQNKREARAGAARSLDLVDNLDYEPAYAADLMPQQYKKTEAPLADAYLNSILTGSNPDTTFSGAPNAQQTKRDQRSRQISQFGTTGDLMDKQRQVSRDNPYQVLDLDRKVGKRADGTSQLRYAQNHDAYDSGVTDDMIHNLGQSNPGGKIKLNADGKVTWRKGDEMDDASISKLVSLYQAGDTAGIDAMTGDRMVEILPGVKVRSGELYKYNKKGQ